ncbi:MAG: AAA family ATPase, partial [Alphaproteobacteria bacterium]|nr:AAA family ATPase [Alphaproteobacteria bacterium]
MRIEMIELREVGIFSGGVRINGISPGLNVLAGPNELGKSTMLKALTTLFFESHRTAKQTVQALRPYAGGAPWVASRFEIGGDRWLLEKQFLSAQRARLERLDGGETHHGADAENRLQQLMSGDAGALASRLPLLWVEQGGDSFVVPKLSDAVRQSLGALLAAQAEVTAGMGPAQAVLRQVEAELAELITVKTGKPRRNGSYDKLLNELAAVAGEAARAREKTAAAEERLSRLAELQREQAELLEPEKAARETQELKGWRERVEAALHGRQQLRQLHHRIEFLSHQREHRAATLATWDEGVRELASIDAAVAMADGQLAAILASATAIDGQTSEVEGAIAQSTER